MFIKSAKKNRHLGVSLVETLFGLGIGAIVLTAVAQITILTSRNYAAITNYADLDRQSRNALDQMSWKIRNATALTAYTTNALTFTYPSSGSLSYSYSSSTKQLTETFNGVNTILLSNCYALEFAVYQRTVVSNTFDQYTTTTPSSVKVIQVSWQCQKSILGSLINSESVQSAKVVMRN